MALILFHNVAAFILSIEYIAKVHAELLIIFLHGFSI